MTVVKSEIRRGAYYDSIVLMQLQSGLAGLEDVIDSGAVMATEANLALLESSGLLRDSVEARPEDLLIVVEAGSETAADQALARVDALLARRRATTTDEYRPKSIDTAVRALPDARWVLISVPGRYAAGVAHQALDHGRHVFLYSDNVSLKEEATLKHKAREAGLLVMGPDCGTAIVGGIGLGFANRVRRGPIGLIGASGTGIQAVTSHIHTLGGGISHALGTGGRDLHEEVGAITAHQSLDLLAHDPQTRVIVLISKPPSPRVAASLLTAARTTGKPVVVEFIGYPAPARRTGDLHFATTLHEAASLAVELAAMGENEAEPAGKEELVTEDGLTEDGLTQDSLAEDSLTQDDLAEDSLTEDSLAEDDLTEDSLTDREEAKTLTGRYLRGLFSGGTLAFEAVQGLRSFLEPVYSNISMPGVHPLADPSRSQAHTVVDLGADELTVGRLHPMIDPDLCLRRLRQEAADTEVGIILLDVVLGDGAAPDPAGALAPAIEEVLRQRGGDLEVVAIVVGTDEDPQNLDGQLERLDDAGARVFRIGPEAVDYVCGRLFRIENEGFPPVDLAGLEGPIGAINIGLESFFDSLAAQGASAVQMDWRPPAGGNERLMAILEKMKR